MPLLSNNALDKLRRVSSLHLNDLCTIYTQTDASAGGGNRIKTPSVLASDVPIHLYNLSLGTEGERVGQVKAVKKMGARIPYNQAVTEKNTITITSLSNRRFQI